jgi:hypothetical protein
MKSARHNKKAAQPITDLRGLLGDGPGGPPLTGIQKL